MSGKTLYEGPDSERDKSAYQTYDERSVSHDEIKRALRRANLIALLSRRQVQAAIVGVAIVVIGLAIWAIYPLISSLMSTSAHEPGSTLVTTAGISLPFQGAALAIFMIIAVPLIAIIGIYLYGKWT